MSRLKVGDKVRIREDLVVGHRYYTPKRDNVLFLEGMKIFTGKETIIKEVDEHRNMYRLSVDGQCCQYTEDMLEPVEQNQNDWRPISDTSYEDYDVVAVVIAPNFGIFITEKVCDFITIKKRGAIAWFPIPKFEPPAPPEPNYNLVEYQVIRVIENKGHSKKAIKDYTVDPNRNIEEQIQEAIIDVAESSGILMCTLFGTVETNYRIEDLTLVEMPF